VKGRKRHIIVDVLGLVLEAVVTPADVADRDMAWYLLDQMAGRFSRLVKLWADSNYEGALEEIAQTHYGRELEIVKRAPESTGFAVQKHRWIVERTLAWLGTYRQLANEYVADPGSSEALIHLTMTHLMLRRLAPT
jgi:putative transposase